MAYKLPPDDRRCAVGTGDERCKAWALKDGSGQCAGHSRRYPVDPAVGTAASAEARTARTEARKRGLLDAISEELERRAEDIVGAYFRAGLKDGDWRAIEALITRTHGKPVERVETTAGGVDELTQAQRDELVRDALAQYPHLRDVGDERAA